MLGLSKVMQNSDKTAKWKPGVRKVKINVLKKVVHILYYLFKLMMTSMFILHFHF